MNAIPPSTMRAIVQDTYGGADTWSVAEVPVPAIAGNEVLVRVEAAGMDRGTWHVMTGLPYLGRLVLGLRRPKQRVPGLDLAGTVMAVGTDVTRFGVGDRVFGIGRGSFAEYAAVRESKLAHMPTGIDAQQAAVVPVSGTTALRAVQDAGRVHAGQHVLIIGASGGVGTYAIQVAKALGAEVTAVCSAAKLDLVRSLGADHVLDYATDDFAAGSRQYDVIIDIAGNATLRRLRRALTPRGTLVIVGGEGGGRFAGGIDRQLRAMALSLFVRQRLTMLPPKEHHVDIERLGALIAAGSVRPSVGATYALDHAAEAMGELVAGRARGKLAIVVADRTG